MLARGDNSRQGFLGKIRLLTLSRQVMLEGMRESIYPNAGKFGPPEPAKNPRRSAVVEAGEIPLTFQKDWTYP